MRAALQLVPYAPLDATFAPSAATFAPSAAPLLVFVPHHSCALADACASTLLRLSRSLDTRCAGAAFQAPNPLILSGHTRA
jgi:hypothetical protein